MGTVWNEWQDNWVGRPIEVKEKMFGQIREQQVPNIFG